MSKRLILCDCSKSQTIDSKVIEAACGVTCSRVHTALCTTQADLAAAEIGKGDAVIACLQERAFFEELAAEQGVAAPGFVDIRDRAGWSANAANATPKMAALVSDALLPRPAEKTMDIVSEGRCIILGDAAVTLPACESLADDLSVTVLLADDADLPTERGFDVVVGTLHQASGSLGNFTLTFKALRQLEPGGRGAFQMGSAREGGRSQCDIIIDLSGNIPLFPAPEKRDGYLRADPKDPLAVAKVVAQASHFVGGFEKPFYLKVEDHLCAHSRAETVGCSKCLDVCPTSAISPAGEHISIDPQACAGCGSCVALCPSGAITYDAPPTEYQFRRIQNLAQTYLAAGGKSPRLLVCDSEFGSEMISLSARFGEGLPPDVIPLEVDALSAFGHAEMLAALACGFTSVDILLAPKTEAETLQQECALACVILGNDTVRLHDHRDPEALSAQLYEDAPKSAPVTPILPQGSRRQITRLAATALRPDQAAPIALPEGAPYGAVIIDKDACTLCLSCAALCPTGALGDNPDTPQLRFQEDACLQCGLCTRICPENAITLKPQFDLSEQALEQVVVHEEEPFACIQCGNLFGVKSTVEKITEKLAGKHSMFASESTAKLIQMCENCRVEAQYNSEDNPFKGKDRPRTVTTDDYFSKRRDH